MYQSYHITEEEKKKKKMNNNNNNNNNNTRIELNIKWLETKSLFVFLSAANRT